MGSSGLSEEPQCLRGDAVPAPARPPVIVLGTGVTALGVLRILARDGIGAYVAHTMDPLLRRSRWFRPAPGKPLALNDDLAAWLEQLGLPSGVLIPCSDYWASAVARLEPTIAARFPSSVSRPETLSLFVDKARFAALLLEAGTPHPRSYDVETLADIDAVPDSMFENAILKPRDSQDFMERYGVKALHVRSRADARDQLDRLRAEGVPVILQEYIGGPATQHYFVDGFIDRFGIVRGIFARQRLRMYPSDFGNSTAMISVPYEAARGAIESVTQLLKSVNYRGTFSAELKLDSRDGVFKMIEVNARPWWYVDFAARCGVDVCQMAYDDALECTVASVSTYTVGRTLVFPYHDYFACLALWRRGELSLLEWTRSWARSMQPVFQFRDPTPALRAAAEVLGSMFRRRVRSIALF